MLTTKSDELGQVDNLQDGAKEANTGSLVEHFSKIGQNK